MSNSKKTTADLISYRRIVDGETGEIVTLTDEQLALWPVMQRISDMSDLTKALAIFHISDKKLYLAGGYSTFKEYAEDRLPFGYRNAKRYVQVGKKFADMLPPIELSKGTPVPRLDEHIVDSDVSEAIGGMGIRKLIELTRIDDALFDDVIEKGRLVMPDGETSFTLEELKGMNTLKMERVIKESRMEREKYQAKIQQLTEAKQLLESERDADAKRLGRMDEYQEEALYLRSNYGGTERGYQEQKAILEECHSIVLDLREKIERAHADCDSPETLRELATQIISECNAAFIQAKYHFRSAITDTGQSTREELEARRRKQKALMENGTGD